MNAMVSFRANAIGSLSPTAAQREEAQNQVWATARATMAGPVAQPKSTEKSGDAMTAALDQEMGRDTFLQLLVMQMQYQDPLEPVNNEDMIAQLAQFSSLEQMNNLNESFENLAAVMSQQSLMSASNLLGHSVTGYDLEGEPIEGTVDRVFMQQGVVFLEVGDHVTVLAYITGIE